MLAHQTTESAPISSNNKDPFTTHQESKTREIFDVWPPKNPPCFLLIELLTVLFLDRRKNLALCQWEWAEFSWRCVASWCCHQQEQRGTWNASLLTISSTFNSLFKVLCIFPSRYLCAIGLSPVFSFRWNLPPNFGLHSQTTRLDESATRVRVASNLFVHDGIVTLLDPSFQRSWTLTDARDATSQDYNSETVHLPPFWSGWGLQDASDFKLELFPFHSPLLRESSLVSFPPLIDMLKFSG